jgi:hypothetical protein
MSHQKLKLMADYGYFPLRLSDPCLNLDPRTLPIGGELVDALNRWAAEYDSTLVADNPKIILVRARVHEP